jgi:hypothetical protein
LATLKQFEEALCAQGMNMALAILEKMRKEEKKTRSIAPARRVSGRKMTPELARKILELHSTTDMTQQEIAFQLGINQGRVNEVIKRGKWLTEDPQSEEAQARDKAKARMKRMQSEDTPISRKQPVAVGVEEAPRCQRRSRPVRRNCRLTISSRSRATKWNLVSAGAFPAGDDQFEPGQIGMVHQQHAALVRELVGRLGEDRIGDHHSIMGILKRCGSIGFLNRLVADSAVVELALNDNPTVILFGNDVGALVA